MKEAESGSETSDFYITSTRLIAREEFAAFSLSKHFRFYKNFPFDKDIPEENLVWEPINLDGNEISPERFFVKRNGHEQKSSRSFYLVWSKKVLIVFSKM
jgi:hypothetical protein